MRNKECPARSAKDIAIISRHETFVNELCQVPLCQNSHRFPGESWNDLGEVVALEPDVIIVCEDATIDDGGLVLDAQKICVYLRSKSTVPIVLITHGEQGRYSNVEQFADVEVRKPKTRRALVEFAAELLRLSERIPPIEPVIIQKPWSLLWVIVIALTTSLVSGVTTLFSTGNSQAAAQTAAALFVATTSVLKGPELFRDWGARRKRLGGGES